jgi:hypothetical protein
LVTPEHADPASVAPRTAVPAKAAETEDWDAAQTRKAGEPKKRIDTTTLMLAGIGVLIVVVAIAIFSSTNHGGDGLTSFTSSWHQSSTASGSAAAPVEQPAPPPPVARNFEPDPAAVSRARRFLDQKELAKTVVEFLHFGADLNEATFTGVGPLNDEAGQPTTGFAVFYRYVWDSDGWTEVAFICNSAGLVSGLQVMKTNAKNSKPFALAKLGGAVMGSFLDELAKNDEKMTDDEKAQFHALVQNTDIPKLLDFYLAFAQRLGP